LSIQEFLNGSQYEGGLQRPLAHLAFSLTFTLREYFQEVIRDIWMPPAVTVVTPGSTAHWIRNEAKPVLEGRLCDIPNLVLLDFGMELLETVFLTSQLWSCLSSVGSKGSQSQTSSPCS
jgi:hypothetical protein